MHEILLLGWIRCTIMHPAINPAVGIYLAMRAQVVIDGNIRKQPGSTAGQRAKNDLACLGNARGAVRNERSAHVSASGMRLVRMLGYSRWR
jgi:hypothetical protein